MSEFKKKRVQWWITEEDKWNECVQASIEAGYKSPSLHARSLHEQVVGLEQTENSTAGRKMAMTSGDQEALRQIGELYKLFGTLDRLSAFVEQISTTTPKQKAILDSYVAKLNALALKAATKK